MPQFALILAAAGQSTRFGGGRNKLLERLGPWPVVGHTYRAFVTRSDVACIVVATADSELIRQALPSQDEGDLPRPPPSTIYCPGGPSRAHSVLNAVRQVPTDVEWVAIHDAARPLASQGLIDRTLAAADRHGAAVPALPVALTIKQADAPLPSRVQRTVPRAALWAMQTPQVMRRADFLASFDACPLPLEQVTDDAQLLELAGRDVWLVPGEERNLKITTALDLRIAEMLLADPRLGGGA
jgi:2-C-methyl-D-erythritol 4-phosphate cytidylyltransferase